MKLTTAALRPLLDKLFVQLGLTNNRYSITQDLVSLLEDNNVHSIEVIQPDNPQYSSWMIRLHDVSGKVLGEFPLPSRLEKGDYDVEQYLKANLESITKPK